MKAGALVLCALLGIGGAARVEKERPVSKVINLLKEMIVQMEKEGEEDEEVYEQMGCWCETNDKEKTQAIKDGKERIEALTAAIEDATANSARLNTEIANLNKEVTKNGAALDDAKGIRTKQTAEFVATEKDMLQSIGSMKSAIVALSKHNKGASFLQVSTTEQQRIFQSVKGVARRHAAFISELTTPEERASLQAFVQAGSLATAPQSGEIFGILEAMKESFETNLAAAQKGEKEEAQAFTDLDAAKSAEISAGKEQAAAKTQELAAAGQAGSQAKMDLEETTKTLEADTAFLANVKEQCATMDEEYEERTKSRQLEIEAVSKALEFLNSDEAHALFSKTFNPSFLQSRAENQQRARLVQTLKAAAGASRDSRLAMLVTSAQRSAMDGFGDLKKSLKTMVDALHKEQADDMKTKDFCVAGFNDISKETAAATSDKEDLDAKIAELNAALETLSKDIEALKAEIAELSKQLKEAGEDREKANKDFQVTVADQVATQKLLQTALGILKGFYEKAALVQFQESVGQPAFKKHSKSKSSGGVMGMMQGIIDDAKALEAEAIRAEEDSQKAYEEFVQDTNDSLQAKNKELATKNQVKGKTESEKLDEEVELDHVSMVLEGLATELADQHKNCDFMMKNFEVRKAAREKEIAALDQAIALFSGAKMASLLQHM